MKTAGFRRRCPYAAGVAAVSGLAAGVAGAAGMASAGVAAAGVTGLVSSVIQEIYFAGKTRSDLLVDPITLSMVYLFSIVFPSILFGLVHFFFHVRYVLLRRRHSGRQHVIFIHDGAFLEFFFQLFAIFFLLFIHDMSITKRLFSRPRQTAPLGVFEAFD